MECSKCSPKGKVYSIQAFLKKQEKQPDLPFKGIRKRRTNKAQSQHKEGNNKDQRENK